VIQRSACQSANFIVIITLPCTIASWL